MRAHHAGDRRAQYAAARNLRADLERDFSDPVRDWHRHDRRVVSDYRPHAVAYPAPAAAPRRGHAVMIRLASQRVADGAVVEPRFDVELVAVTKRYDKTLAVDAI